MAAGLGAVALAATNSKRALIGFVSTSGSGDTEMSRTVSVLG